MILFGIAITWVGANRRRRLRRLRRNAGVVGAVVESVLRGPGCKVTKEMARQVVVDVEEVSGWLGVKDSEGPQR